MSEDKQHMVELFQSKAFASNREGDLFDAKCYIAIHYDKDERKPKMERIQYAVVYHTEEDMQETSFKIMFDDCKNGVSGTMFDVR